MSVNPEDWDVDFAFPDFKKVYSIIIVTYFIVTYTPRFYVIYSTDRKLG